MWKKTWVIGDADGSQTCKHLVQQELTHHLHTALPRSEENKGELLLPPTAVGCSEQGMCEDPSLSTGHSRAALLESGLFPGAGARAVPLHR